MLEFRIAPESIHSLVELLAIALGLSILACLSIVGPLLNRRWQLGSRGELLSKFLLASLASLHVLAWHLYLYRQSHDAIELAYLLVAVAVGGLLWRLAAVKPSALPPRLRGWLPVSLACLAVVQLAGFAMVTKCFADFQPVSDRPLLAPPGELVASAEAYAQTDLGTRLKLYQRRASVEEFELFINSTRANMSALTERAIRRDEPRLNTNCHGWVFTGGRYIVGNQDVETILNENGYMEVVAPALNDVVVYRGPQGQVIHTGVVRGFLGNEAALVESKWGVEGTYLHLATEQPYSQHISYWHTDRGTHLLHTVSAPWALSASLR